MKGPKKIAVIIVAALFVYLSLHTWNLRTGHLDALSSYTGLDISGVVLRPGTWVKDKVVDFWERYIYLMNLKQINDDLTEENNTLRRTNMLLSEQARSAHRLEDLLAFTPPEEWTFTGTRVIAHRMGPASGLATITVDKGYASGVTEDMPVTATDGVVGRIWRTGAGTSTVLLLTDANSHIAVMSDTHRSPGMLTGQGYGRELKLRYVNQNAAIDPGELLLTSGLSGIFPKGLPVARVTKIQRSDISLFLTVLAEPLVDMAAQEEVLLLSRVPAPAPAPNKALEQNPAEQEGVDGAADQ